MSDETPAVALRDVSFSYDGALVLERVSLEVPEGDFLGIIGPNGGGKTTLLRLVLGLNRPNSGEVRVFGRPPQQVRRQMGYVPQKPNLDPDFPISVEEVVLMGRLGQSRLVWRYRAEDREAARQAMEDVEIQPLRKQLFGKLSGGQQRRALIARALATRPRLLLLDEPTVGVDHRVEHEIYSLLDRLNEQMTIVLVSHDVGCVTEHVNRLACVHQRVFCHEADEITGEVIEAIYRGPAEMTRHHPEEQEGGD
ncbi:MAG: ABC transporter ATP-binding protein [Candidatus Brocadiia bacterium]